MRRRKRVDFAKLGSRAGLVFVTSFVFLALWGMIAPPYDPIEPHLNHILEGPSAKFWAGTDQFGRDVFSRILVGAEASILVSLGAVGFATLAGLVLGAITGYAGGVIDRVVGIVVDGLLAFPGILLALAILAAFGPSRAGVIFALGLAYLPSVVRVSRSSALSVKDKEFVLASIAMGHPSFFTLLRHVVPNSLAPLTVLATAMMASAVLSESALSFLGLGVPPPEPSLGSILADSRDYLGRAPWMGVFPGVTIALALLGINLLGDALRDRLDPRMRGR